MLSTNHANLDQAYDFGYYLYDGKSKEEMKNNGDVVFNIFNFYKVDKCSKEGNYVLKYGSLAESIRNKSKHD